VLYYHNIILLVPYSWVIMFDLWKSFSRGFCSCFVIVLFKQLRFYITSGFPGVAFATAAY
jgi:hypothetical protein